MRRVADGKMNSQDTPDGLLIKCRYKRCKKRFKPKRADHYYHDDKCRKADWEERYGRQSRKVNRRLDSLEARIIKLEDNEKEAR